MPLHRFEPRCPCAPGAWSDLAAAPRWALFSKVPTTRCRPILVRAHICWTGRAPEHQKGGKMIAWAPAPGPCAATFWRSIQRRKPLSARLRHDPKQSSAQTVKAGGAFGSREFQQKAPADGAREGAGKSARPERCRQGTATSTSAGAAGGTNTAWRKNSQRFI